MSNNNPTCGVCGNGLMGGHSDSGRCRDGGSQWAEYGPYRKRPEPALVMTPDGERRARACISIAQEMILSALMAIDQGDPESADAFVSDAISDLGKARMHITRPSDPTKTPPKTTV